MGRSEGDLQSCVRVTYLSVATGYTVTNTKNDEVSKQVGE